MGHCGSKIRDYLDDLDEQRGLEEIERRKKYEIWKGKIRLVEIEIRKQLEIQEERLKLAGIEKQKQLDTKKAIKAEKQKKNLLITSRILRA